jgi:hypothetical protein
VPLGAVVRARSKALIAHAIEQADASIQPGPRISIVVTIHANRRQRGRTVQGFPEGFNVSAARDYESALDSRRITRARLPNSVTFADGLGVDKARSAHSGCRRRRHAAVAKKPSSMSLRLAHRQWNPQHHEGPLLAA